MPLLGADSVNQTYHYLVGNGAAAMALIPVMIITAGFGEETFFRGYLFERFGKLIGHSPGAKIVTVLLTSIAFASLHYFDQGWAGAAAGDDNRTRVWNDFRIHGQDLDANVCARRIRSDCGSDNLLGSGIERDSLRVQIVNRVARPLHRLRVSALHSSELRASGRGCVKTHLHFVFRGSSPHSRGRDRRMRSDLRGRASATIASRKFSHSLGRKRRFTPPSPAAAARVLRTFERARPRGLLIAQFDLRGPLHSPLPARTSLGCRGNDGCLTE